MVFAVYWQASHPKLYSPLAANLHIIGKAIDHMSEGHHPRGPDRKRSGLGRDFCLFKEIQPARVER